MSRQIQIRRGTTAENDAFTGAIGEITMDTTRKTVRVHDGETVGGTTLAKQSDIPSAESITNAVMPDYENATDFPALGTYTATTNLYLQGYVQLVWNALHIIISPSRSRVRHPPNARWVGSVVPEIPVSCIYLSMRSPKDAALALIPNF